MSAHFCGYTETHRTTDFNRINVMAYELYLSIAVFRNKEKRSSSRIRLTSLWLYPTAWHGTWPLVGILLRNLITGDRNPTLTGSCGWKILEWAVFRYGWIQELKYLKNVSLFVSWLWFPLILVIVSGIQPPSAWAHTSLCKHYIHPSRLILTSSLPGDLDVVFPFS